MSLALLQAGGAYASARDCAWVAGRFSQAAARRHLRRIAVMPFQGSGGEASRSGVIVSERLMAELIDRGGIEIVERSLLETVLREQRLGAAGFVDPATAQKLGRFLGVEAVVAGTTIELLGSAVEVHARLIEVETARVVAAATARVEKDWSDFEASSSWALAVPTLPAPPEETPSDWHDSVRSEPGCDPSEDALLEARAHYWALRLRDPRFDRSSLRRNPGSEIADPAQRERFYGRLRRWYDEPSVPPLSDEARALLSRCAP